ncbi:MAG: hypothetical protein ACFFKA_02875 [Candidatus Thorarchaeota archaeon]
MAINSFIREYLTLALRINKIFDGYVDSYYGAPELKALVDREPVKSLKDLVGSVKKLLKELPKQINDSLREKCLRANLKSMEVFLDFQIGQNVGFIEKIEAILGIRPETFKNDKEFYELQDKYGQVFSGSGTLAERVESYKKRRYIPQNEIIPKFKRALEITSKRTKELFPDLLPDSEFCEIQQANKEIGWSFYNHYKGNYISVIEVNPYQTLYWTTFLPNAAHEGYPGHHTEFTVKNKLLFNQLGWSEYCIILMNTPAGVITEGIAETAPFMLFPPNKRVSVELEEFCINPNEEDSIEAIVEQNEVKQKLNRFKIHLANLANIDKWSEEQLLQYGMNFGFYPKDNLQSLIHFILNPKFQIIHYTYNYGIELIAKKFGFPPKLEDFKYLLCNPVLSSDLV